MTDDDDEDDTLLADMWFLPCDSVSILSLPTLMLVAGVTERNKLDGVVDTDGTLSMFSRSSAGTFPRFFLILSR